MRTRTMGGGLLLLAVIGIGVSGCIGGASAPAKFYTLASVATPVPGMPANSNLPLGIGPVTIPAYLDRPQIVTRRGPEELYLAEFERWSEPLKAGIQRVMADNMTALLGTDRISPFPWASAPAGQVQITVDVTRFEGTAGQGVTLNARWRLLGSDGTELVVRQSAITESMGSGGYDALTAAMSRALGALSRDVAVAVQELRR